MSYNEDIELYSEEIVFSTSLFGFNRKSVLSYIDKMLNDASGKQTKLRNELAETDGILQATKQDKNTLITKTKEICDELDRKRSDVVRYKQQLSEAQGNVNTLKTKLHSKEQENNQLTSEKAKLLENISLLESGLKEVREYEKNAQATIAAAQKTAQDILYDATAESDEQKEILKKAGLRIEREVKKLRNELRQVQSSLLSATGGLVEVADSIVVSVNEVEKDLLELGIVINTALEEASDEIEVSKQEIPYSHINTKQQPIKEEILHQYTAQQQQVYSQPQYFSQPPQSFAAPQYIAQPSQSYAAPQYAAQPPQSYAPPQYIMQPQQHQNLQNNFGQIPYGQPKIPTMPQYHQAGIYMQNASPYYLQPQYIKIDTRGDSAQSFNNNQESYQKQTITFEPNQNAPLHIETIHQVNLPQPTAAAQPKETLMPGAAPVFAQPSQLQTEIAEPQIEPPKPLRKPTSISAEAAIENSPVRDKIPYRYFPPETTRNMRQNTKGDISEKSTFEQQLEKELTKTKPETEQMHPTKAQAIGAIKNKQAREGTKDNYTKLQELAKRRTKNLADSILGSLINLLDEKENKEN